VLGTLGKASDFQALNMEGFWRHSIAVGVTAKLIASKRKRGLEAARGILHRRAAARHRQDPAEQPDGQGLRAGGLADRPGPHPAVPVRRAASFGASRLGGQADRGELAPGENLSDAVAYHHHLADYTGKHRELVLTVAVANLFSNTYELGFSGDRYPRSWLPR